MRILHVTDCYLPRLGGIEMHINDLATRQAAAGHQVTVMTRTRPGPDGDTAGPVPVERLACGPLALGTGHDISDYVRGHHVDLVHAHLSVASPLGWAALRGARSYPAVATVHSVVPDAPELLRTTARLTGIPLPSVTFTTVSEVAAAPWRRAFGERMPVRVLPNGIDPEDWAGPHITSPNNTFTVVSVGRFAPRKRLEALLPILVALRAHLPEMRLRAILVGDGPQLPKLRRDVRLWGLDDVVELPGKLTRPQIKDILHRADVYLAPATLESFGIAALEARCAGVPVIAMAQGGAGEFIDHGLEGFLVKDDHGLFETTLRLARDPDLRRRIHEHNAATRPPVAWPEVLTLHDNAYTVAGARTSTSHTSLAMVGAAVSTPKIAHHDRIPHR
ncbi:MAG: glycosyltransferase family 4 protein [Ornithinimicrobium sp.]